MKVIAIIGIVILSLIVVFIMLAAYCAIAVSGHISRIEERAQLHIDRRKENATNG